MRPVLIAVGFLAAIPAAAQWTSAPYSYIDAVPLEYPRLRLGTDATAEVGLYGDPYDAAFVDRDPVDGIDDARGRRLQELAVRFAPYLVLNTTNVPMSVERFIEDGRVSPLHVETWELSGQSPQIISREAVEWRRLGGTTCDQGNVDDCLYLDLLDRFHPISPSDPSLGGLATKAGEDQFSVLFFDFPGADEGDWKEEYTDGSGALPERYRPYVHLYAHPFVHERLEEDGRSYELVIQYWVYYPTNDGGNNHEGDWEHINVVVAPLDRVADRLGIDDIRTLVDTAVDVTSSESMPVIRRVEYYFHHHLITLDYSRPNVYRPRAEWDAELRSIHDQRVGAGAWWRLIRNRAYWDEEETVLNTHPFGFIGADNKGFDQVMAPPGNKNRDSHGTYPFPGLFKDIGPAGATEEIGHAFDFRHWYREWKKTGRRPPETFVPGSMVAFDDPDRITLLPDAEALLQVVPADPDARRSLGWMLLPIYWGQPRTTSPFSALVAHADLGNIAPPGPAHNSGWNRSGPTSSYSEYEAHRFVPVFPLGFQDNFSNSLGFLNLTTPTLVALPPFDFAWRIVSLPVRAAMGRFHPTYFPGDPAPPRLVGVTAGVAWHRLPIEFADLLYDSDSFDGVIGALLIHLALTGTEGTLITGQSESMARVAAPDFTLFFNLGNRLVTENTFRNVRAGFDLRIRFSDAPDFVLAGDVNLWEYVGSFRYNLGTGSVQPFLKAGYGLSWYRVEDLTTDGISAPVPESPWVRKPNLLRLRNVLPNTMHVGTGIELIPLRNTRVLPGGIGLGLRAQVLFFRHDLGLDERRLDLETLVALGTTAASLPRDRAIWRSEVALGLTVAF